MEYQIQPTPSMRTAKSVSSTEIAGKWTPVFGCASPGDLSVSYTTQTGYYTRQGTLLILHSTLEIVPTFTTASGDLAITGLPFYGDTFTDNVGFMRFTGGTITPPTNTIQITPMQVSNLDGIKFVCMGASAIDLFLEIGDITSGSTFVIVLTMLSRLLDPNR